MSRPAPQHRRQQIYRWQYRQAVWPLLAWPLAYALAYVLGLIPSAFATSLVLGMVVQLLAQGLFTYIAYRHTGAQASRRIMMNMYLGQMCKWLVTVAGFMLVFKLYQPMYGWAVFVGYLSMLVIGVLMMKQLK